MEKPKKVPLSGIEKTAILLNVIGQDKAFDVLKKLKDPDVRKLLAVMRNGLLLIGWNFFWQQVGIGVLVFLVLALSFGLRKREE